MKQSERGKNLEQLIRQILIFKSERYILKLFEKKYVIDHDSKVIYKVKLNKFILDNELQCLLILDKKQISEHQSQQMQRQLLNELTGNVAGQIKQAQSQKLFSNFSLQNENNGLKNQRKLLHTNNSFLYSGYNEEHSVHKEIYNKVKIMKKLIKNYCNIKFVNKLAELQSIIHNKIFLKLLQIFCDLCSLNMEFKLIQDQRYIISIIMTSCKLIEFMNGKLPQFTIKIFENQKEQIQMSICFAITSKQHDQAIYQLLQANWIGSNMKKFNQQQQYEHCIERLCLLITQYNLPMLLLFDIQKNNNYHYICAMQVLLSQISLFNHLKVRQNSQFIEFQCFFQNNEKL